MEKLGLIFPGQGAQKIGMGADVAAEYPVAREVYDRANELLGFDLAGLCFEGPQERLEQTDIQQPAIFVTSVAIWRALAEQGMCVENFQATAGLSLGEYTALHIAGAVEFDDALRLVRRRGELMQQSATEASSGMVSLIGADAAKAEALCEMAAEGDVLVPANFNCPGQIVLSGGLEACRRAVSMASETGCKGVPLPVAGAFHSPFMQSAADGLAAVLDDTVFAEPQIAVYCNVDAMPHGSVSSIREKLKLQLTHAVLWQRTMEATISEGIGRYVEVGPGKVLAGLLRKIDRKVSTVSANSRDSIADALAVPSAG